MSDAKERLRQKAQNEQTCIALNDLLNTKDDALAAKDARIAELEGVLAKALAFTEANTFGGTDAMALIKECHAAIAGQQQQPGPATPSEDGGETELAALEQALDEECGRSGNAVPVGVPLYSISLPEIHAAILSAGYVQPAQHERIVAAKDAEIARLCKLAYIGEHQFEDCTYKFRLEELRAQPARQQSEDERECQHQRTHYSQRNGGEHVCSNCGESANDAQPARQVGVDCGHAACESLGEPHPFCDFVKQMDARQVVRDREADRQRFSDPAFNQWLDEVISDAGHTVWDQIPDVCCAWHGWENRQHYAPAAVADEVIRQELEELKKWAIAQGRPKCGVKGCERLADSPWTNCREHWR